MHGVVLRIGQSERVPSIPGARAGAQALGLFSGVVKRDHRRMRRAFRDGGGVWHSDEGRIMSEARARRFERRYQRRMRRRRPPDEMIRAHLTRVMERGYLPDQINIGLRERFASGVPPKRIWDWWLQQMEELRGGSGGGSSGGFGGVREPRRPRPGSGSGGEQVNPS